VVYCDFTNAAVHSLCCPFTNIQVTRERLQRAALSPMIFFKIALLIYICILRNKAAKGFVVAVCFRHEMIMNENNDYANI